MPVFQIRNGKAQRLDVVEFPLERALQRFFEDNLEELLGVRLVASEYEISSKSGRIDTFGIDENNRPVIIEYKLGIAGDEVLAQGLSYQKWLNNNRKHFNLLVKEKLNTEVDWQLIRLIFIAKDFGSRIRDAVEDDKGVVLVRYALNQNELVVLDKISGQFNWDRKNISSNVQQVLSEDIERYLVLTKQELHEPFRHLRNKLLQLSGTEEIPQKKVGITYYKTQAIARFEFRKSRIDLLLKTGAVSDDPDHRLEDITSYKWGFPFLFKISAPEHVEYAFNLIQAAYLAAT